MDFQCFTSLLSWVNCLKFEQPNYVQNAWLHCLDYNYRWWNHDEALFLIFTLTLVTDLTLISSSESFEYYQQVSYDQDKANMKGQVYGGGPVTQDVYYG